MLPKNVRFNNYPTHSYNHISKHDVLLQYLHITSTEEYIAQCIFNLQLSSNHVFKDDGTKETIDSLLEVNK